mmetsp:Transcript_25359/g.64635  ORF Transcript_25359/g.64635 Transcript_25359/m.64635 type:complete len:382 (-) Transcript_25359:510-1655(-)
MPRSPALHEQCDCLRTPDADGTCKNFGPHPVLLDLGQGSRGDALTNTLEVIVSGVELNIRVIGELFLQHLLRGVQDDVASIALAHAAQDHDVVDVIELAVLPERVAQVHAASLVNLRALFLLLGIRHGLLDKLQTLRMVLVLDGPHFRVREFVMIRDVDTALHCELRRATLSQVQVREAGVSALGPRVRRSLRVQVEPEVAQLVDPAHQVAVLVGVAGSLAAAHRDAHDVALLDLLVGRQGCHLTIVDNLQGNVASQLLGKPLEDVNDLLLVHVRGHVREDVAPSGLVVCGDGTGGAAADGIDLGQGRLGQLQGIHDGIVVVLRVRIGDIPLGLLRVQDLVVLDGDGLDVALAQVEGQPAATGILAADLLLVLGHGQVACT